MKRLSLSNRLKIQDQGQETRRKKQANPSRSHLKITKRRKKNKSRAKKISKSKNKEKSKKKSRSKKKSKSKNKNKNTRKVNNQRANFSLKIKLNNKISCFVPQKTSHFTKLFSSPSINR